MEAAESQPEAGSGSIHQLRVDPTAGMEIQDPAHIELFVSWYTLGGPRRPPTPLELMEWPLELKQDFEYLTLRLNHIKDRRDRRNARRNKARAGRKGK